MALKNTIYCCFLLYSMNFNKHCLNGIEYVQLYKWLISLCSVAFVNVSIVPVHAIVGWSSRPLISVVAGLGYLKQALGHLILQVVVIRLVGENETVVIGRTLATYRTCLARNFPLFNAFLAKIVRARQDYVGLLFHAYATYLLVVYGLVHRLYPLL